METDDDEWELRLVHRPKGTYRSKSRKTPGADSELLRETGTNRLIGPAESKAVDDGDLMTPPGLGEPPPSRGSGSSPFAESFRDEFGHQAGQILADALAHVLAKIISEVVLPAVDEHLIPALKRRFQAAVIWVRAGIQKRRGAADVIEEITIVATPASSAEEARRADNSTEVTMTFAEFHARFQLLVEAEDFVQRMKDELAEANLSDELLANDAGPIARQLQENVAALDDQGLARLLDWLGGRRGAGGQYLLALPATQTLELPPSSTRPEPDEA